VGAAEAGVVDVAPNPPNAGVGASFGVVDPNAIFGFGSSFSSSRPRFDLTLPKAKDGALSFLASIGAAGAELAPPKLNAGVAGAAGSAEAAGAGVLPNLNVEDDDAAGVVAAGVALEDDPPNEKAGFLLLDPPKEIDCFEFVGLSEDDSPLSSRLLFGLDSATSPSSGFAVGVDPKEKVALAGAGEEDDVEPKMTVAFFSAGLALSAAGTGAEVAAPLPNVKPLEDVDGDLVEESDLEAPPKEKPLEAMDPENALAAASFDEVPPLPSRPGRGFSHDAHLFKSSELRQ